MSVANDSDGTGAASRGPDLTDALPSTSDAWPPGSAIDKMVRIKAGKDQDAEIFEVHQGLLKFYSGYFRVAIRNIEQGRFIEAEENMITLPEEKPKVVRAFVSWLYTRWLQTADDAAMTGLMALSELWCFADRREIPLLQNLVIDELHYQMVERMSEADSCLPIVYEGTFAGSPLRRLFIKLLARKKWLWASDSLSEEAGNWCADSLRDLALELLPRPQIWTPEQADQLYMCEFHVHEEGVKCSTT